MKSVIEGGFVAIGLLWLFCSTVAPVVVVLAGLKYIFN